MRNKPTTFYRLTRAVVLVLRWTFFLTIQIIRATAHGVLMLTDPFERAPVKARIEAPRAWPRQERLTDTVPDVIEAGDPKTGEYIQTLFKAGKL